MQKTAPISKALQVQVRRLARELGDARAAEVLGIGRQTVTRAAAGLDVRPSVAALIEVRLPSSAAK